MNIILAYPNSIKSGFSTTKKGKAIFDKAALESLNKSDAVALTGDASVLTVQRWFSSHTPGLKKKQ